jgi:hypothetical protein
MQQKNNNTKSNSRFTSQKDRERDRERGKNKNAGIMALKMSRNDGGDEEITSVAFPLLFFNNGPV